MTIFENNIWYERMIKKSYSGFDNKNNQQKIVYHLNTSYTERGNKVELLEVVLA